jgi:hypothetical protein
MTDVETTTPVEPPESPISWRKQIDITLDHLNNELLALRAKQNTDIDPPGGSLSDSETFKLHRWIGGGGGGGDGFAGEVWVQGQHFFDSSNFSPSNTSGTAIGGAYAGAEWLVIDLQAMSVTYSGSGPSGATFATNKTYRRLSECGGGGKYILC